MTVYMLSFCNFAYMGEDQDRDKDNARCSLKRSGPSCECDGKEKCIFFSIKNDIDFVPGHLGRQLINKEDLYEK